MKLPFHNRLTQCYPDGMHTIKDVVEHIYNLIIGREDSHKVRSSEIAANRFGLKRTRDGAHIRKERCYLRNRGIHFFSFLDTLTLLCAEVQDSTCLDDLDERVHLSLTRMERDFPMSIQVISTSL